MITLTTFEKGAGRKLAENCNPVGDNWFTNNYIPTTGIEYYTVEQIYNAFVQSEEFLAQAVLDQKRVEKLAKEILLTDKFLFALPVLASVDGILYGVGGRYRINAIKSGLQHLNAGEQQMPAIVVQMSMTQLLRGLELDNTSRTMSATEKGSLKAQYLGYRPGDDDTISTVTPQKGADLVQVLSQFILDKCEEQLFVQWSQSGVSGYLALSKDTILVLINRLVKFVLTRDTPRPPAGKLADDIRKLIDEHEAADIEAEVQTAYETKYPVPEKVKCHLTLQDIVDADVPQDIIQFLYAHIPLCTVPSTLVAREVRKANFLYEMVCEFADWSTTWEEDGVKIHAAMFDFLNRINEQHAPTVQPKKGKRKSVDTMAMFREIIAGAEASDDEKALMLQRLQQKLVGEYAATAEV